MFSEKLLFRCYFERTRILLFPIYAYNHTFNRFKVSVSDQLSDKGPKDENYNVTIEDDWRYRCKWVRIFIFLSLIHFYL